MKAPPKIVFFGSFGKFSEVYPEILKKSGFEIILEVKTKNADFEKIKEELCKTEPDVGLIAYFGKIIPGEILKLAKRGFLNVHPSLLPRWRGPSPVQAALLAGDEKTGVTIHIATEKFDAGPVLAQKEIPISPQDTCLGLTRLLAVEGAALLIATLPKWLSGDIKPAPQDESRATYSKIIKTDDGKIDWRRPAAEIHRQIRAFNPEPGTFTFWNQKRLIISEVKKSATLGVSLFTPGTVLAEGETIKIATGKGFIIPLKLKLEGKKETSPQSFLRGHPKLKSATLGV